MRKQFEIKIRVTEKDYQTLLEYSMRNRRTMTSVLTDKIHEIERQENIIYVNEVDRDRIMDKAIDFANIIGTKNLEKDNVLSFVSGFTYGAIDMQNYYRGENKKVL